MRRRVGLFLAVGVLLPLALAAEASAQGATLAVDVPSAKPGDLITVTGAGYTRSNNHIEGGVDIRIGTRDSDPIANTNVGSDGRFTISFLAPQLPPGEYLLIGTELSKGDPPRHVFGSPGRAKLRMIAAAGAAAPGGRGPGDMPPAVLVGSILALLGLTGGTVLCARTLRARTGRTQPEFSR